MVKGEGCGLHLPEDNESGQLPTPPLVGIIASQGEGMQVVRERERERENI